MGYLRCTGWGCERCGESRRVDVHANGLDVGSGGLVVRTTPLGIDRAEDRSNLGGSSDPILEAWRTLDLEVASALVPGQGCGHALEVFELQVALEPSDGA